MKKTLLYFISVISVALLLISCGGVYHAGLDTSNPNYTEYNGSAMGILPPPGPTTLARANMINSQAEINRAVAQQLSQFQNKNEINLDSQKTKYVGVIINIDARKSVWVMHPEMDEQRELKPGESSFYFVNTIPRYIYVHYENKRTERKRIWKSSKYYNGIKIDFGARIMS